MSRQETVSAQRELEALRERWSQPRQILVTTQILPVERCDRPGWVDPITGDQKTRALEVIDDLAVLVCPADQSRINRWELRGELVADFDSIAAEAVDFREATIETPVHHVPIRFMCPADHVEDLRDDETQTVYWSGGWRSGKTYRMDQWWARGWVRYGGRGERLWLVGPDLMHAWKMAEKIFIGRESTGSLFPVHPTDRDAQGRPRSMVAVSLPRSVYSANQFEMIDGTVIEMHHAKGEGGNLEGDSVKRIAIDEAVRIKSVSPYNVCIGRVMEHSGQVGLASVPHDAGMWVYENVVSEFERTKHDEDCSIKVRYVSTYDNPWIAEKAAKRAEKNIIDPIERAQKIGGAWTLRQMYAYGDVWDEHKFSRDELSHDAGAWGMGPDITGEVSKRMFKLPRGVSYIGGADFNDPPKCQGRLIARVYGRLEDWESWHLVFLDEVSSAGDAASAAKELRQRGRGRYKGMAICGDANGFHASNREGGQRQKMNAAAYYKQEGFVMRPPIRRASPGQPAKYSNPGVGDSRTVLRNRMRAGKIWVNAGKCPRLLNAIARAPNRRKLTSDKNTWIEDEIYSLEDAARYLVWRVFSKFVLAQEQKPRDELKEGAA